MDSARTITKVVISFEDDKQFERIEFDMIEGVAHKGLSIKEHLLHLLKITWTPYCTTINRKRKPVWKRG